MDEDRDEIEGERQHAYQGGHARQRREEGRHSHAKQQRRECEAGDASQRGEDEALGEQLPDESASTCPEREPPADLAMTGVRSRDHDVRHVCGGCDQDEQERREHRRQDCQQLEGQRDCVACRSTSARTSSLARRRSP